ncbi:MAG: hypothetical protein NW223_03000 [Hyphomicrobiaceae bacterium]|nr:hypothetical protein [Hyphomicrobiaceae bacterium]
MTRRTKALSGASQDAYFRRVLKSFPDVGEEARERIVRRLRGEIAQLRVRQGAHEAAGAVGESAAEAGNGEAIEVHAGGSAAPADRETMAGSPSRRAAVATAAEPFDPFAINVIVVLRTAGKDAALKALNGIGDADNLRLLAREQRLSVDDDLSTTEALTAAIVAAAERRIANRRAAAGGH